MGSKDAAQNPATEKDAAELVEYKKRLRSRICPYCNEPIKHYIFSSINIPFEYMAQTSAENREEVQSKYSLYSWESNAFDMFCRVLLTSTCTCGNVSFWECSIKDINALISDTMQGDGYFIELIYAKETIRDMCEKTSDEQFKKNLESILKLFPDTKGE